MRIRYACGSGSCSRFAQRHSLLRARLVRCLNLQEISCSLAFYTLPRTGTGPAMGFVWVNPQRMAELYRRS
jgi:hypothetical protein